VAIRQDLLHFLHVNMLAILLHDDGVQWVTELMGYRLSHQFGAHRLGHCSLEVDTAGHTGELENLATILSILVFSSLNLNVLFLVDQTL